SCWRATESWSLPHGRWIARWNSTRHSDSGTMSGPCARGLPGSSAESVLMSTTTHVVPVAVSWTRPSKYTGHFGFFLLAVVLFFYLSLFRDALIDDAFITLRYVKTLVTDGTWGFFPGYVSNTATSPLNVLLLSGVSMVTRSPVDAVIWLTLIELLVLALLL